MSEKPQDLWLALIYYGDGANSYFALSEAALREVVYEDFIVAWWGDVEEKCGKLPKTYQLAIDRYFEAQENEYIDYWGRVYPDDRIVDPRKKSAGWRGGR